MASCGDHLAQDLVFNWRILRADVAGDASDRRIGLTSSSSLRAVRTGYDYRLVKQSLRREYRFPPGASPFCIMEVYAAHCGEWSSRFGTTGGRGWTRRWATFGLNQPA